MNKTKQNTSIAIIGMGCLFPESSTLKEYWRLLFRGEDGITDVPETHWSPKDYFDKDPKKPDHTYCKRGGFLSPVLFDPSEFGIPPSSLEATDTSQLLGLVAAKMALEDSGYGNGRDFNRNRTSVILGVTGTQELVISLGARLGHPKWRKALSDSGISFEKTEEVIKRISDSYVSWQENSFPGLLGNVVAGRISNRLDLGGTNCVVDAACASSMSAIHLAINELISRRSDMVLTGGVDTLNDIFMHMCFSKTHVLSPTGDARPFSKDADGTVLGEGIGIVALKRLEDAEKDNDRIYAVIKGIGTSSDGKSQSIYAPSAEGQIKALRRAYKDAGINPTGIELIEAHGTGTRVGDMVEFQALNRFFGESAGNGNRCALGSVKSMIGHAKAAAGAAGLIKSALSLYNKVLPPTLKADEPDPNMDINESHFYLNTEAKPWFSKNDHPRRSGVSAFGFGGSNFHIVLEEYGKNKQNISWDGSVEIVALSASTQKELAELLRSFKSVIDKRLSDKEIAIAAAKTRDNFSHEDQYRLLLVIERPFNEKPDISEFFADALNVLETDRQKNIWNMKNIFYGGPEKCGKIAFVFPGQGSQYIDMGCDFVCSFPEALDVLENANKKFKSASSSSCFLSDFIYPYPAQTKEEKKNYEETLRRTDIAQPAIGAISMSMLKILERFNVKPDAVCGHSFGELTALCAAGWIDIDTFLDLSITRGNLMASSKHKGSMLAVKAPLDELAALVGNKKSNVILANRNSPDRGVLSGSIEAIERVEKICRQKGLIARKLPVSAAFHSSLVKDAQKPFEQVVKKANVIPSNIRVFSNATGKPYPDDPDKAKKLLGKQILSPVDFVGEIENLFDSGIRTFVEVGPKPILTGLVKSILKDRDFQAISMDSSSGRRSGTADLARLLCHLASIGHLVELSRWEDPVSTSATRKQLMSIPITGANYRSRETGIESRESGIESRESGVESRESGVGREETSTEIKNELMNNKLNKPMNINNKPIIQNDLQQTDFVSDALKTVQEGLKSMQALQMQTAETHKKFLETQNEAGRTLQNMMENTRRLAEASLGIGRRETGRRETEVGSLESGVGRSDEIGVGVGVRQSSIFNLQSSIGNQQDEVQDETGVRVGQSSIGNLQSSIQNNMLEVVSLLTGYPEEMLGLDMDIEADLGIDSIKRVEILSALEEKISGLPSISPEVMGGLKTLGQIVEYLGGMQEGEAGSGERGAGSREQGAGSRERGAGSGRSDEIEVGVGQSSIGNLQSSIQNNMLEVVSLLTGYPEEMLGLDMDIEADLGIDSIKRVEILSALEEKISGLPSISPEVMGGLKTLGQIVEYLGGMLEQGDGETGDGRRETGVGGREFDTGRVDRRVVSVVKASIDYVKKLSIPDKRKIFITDDKTGLSEAIADELRSLDIDAVILSSDALPDILKGKKNLSLAGGLIIIPDPESEIPNQDMKDAFLLTNHIAPSLLDSAKRGGAIFATITRLDGAFGFKGKKIANPLLGGLAGLAKTASIEWKDVCCHTIDITPDWIENKKIAKAVANELLNHGHFVPVEVGLEPNARYILKLESSPYPQYQAIQTDLEPDDVVLITGGAKGITASCAMALAKYVKPTLVILGRSPHPSPEPEWLISLQDEAAVKRAILDNEFDSSNASPIQIEKAFKKHMANREIGKNLENLRKNGNTALYYPVDVRDSAGVNAILNDVRLAHGPIKGIIHGAGVLEDCLIINKTSEQFEKVFDTKVEGLAVLLEATKNDNLKYLVLFSSVTARIGNKGQADYAMANEALNKIAQQESITRPDCRVISINWGPWDGGMVSPFLKREFERNKIDLIPTDAGALSMLYEMMGDKSSPVEVVIGASLETRTSKTLSLAPRRKEKLSFILKREIDVDRYPILASHVLNGKPVVPFALIVELLGHGALHENPGFFLHGFDDIRILNGIKLDQKKKIISLMAGKAGKKGSIFEVDVEIRNNTKNNKELIYDRAKAILTESLPQPPVFNKPERIDSKTYSRSMDEVYEKILFHGDELRAIKKITGYSSNGMTAEIFSAPPPAKWIADPLRSSWIGDPLILDAAFQLAIIWCFEEMGVVTLPGYSACYRQYRNKFPSDGVTVVLEIKEVTNHKIKCDFTFLDTDNVVIAGITGCETIMDASLFNAFKSKCAA